MAHPDEPQRPLTAPSAESPPPRSGTRAALALFALALLACLAVYLVLSVPGSWFPSATTQAIGARGLSLTLGAGVPDGDAIAITAVDGSGVARLTANTNFRSAEYPIVAWNGFGFPQNADVRFLWRSDYAPNKVNVAPVTVTAGGLAPLVMASNPEWIGRILGIALEVRGTLPQPARVTGVAIKPGGAWGQLTDRAREWLAFERWSGTSINTITGGAEVQELPLPTLLVIAAVIALGVWALFARRARRFAALPAVAALLFLAAWALLDAQWTANLARQVSQTRDQYGGKDWRERHLAAEDGALFAFVERVRAKLPARPTRVFVVADAAYFRGRAAYHLYPHNVYFDPFRNALPPPSALHAGDYVLVYHRRGLQYNADEKKMRFESGSPISAEAVLVEPGAVLLKVL
ncbi:MAG: hypothetical protein IT518_03455 [Burkholderiales bacterium]|nr:hypothetical protein [Burkholderiales bacterium]